jgi:HTH-type transcriptional regulator / antitoxin HipB
MSASGNFMRVQSPADLGLAIRERRKALKLDQRTLAERVGVSRQWIIEIEHGKPGAELGLVLRTLRELDIQLDATTETPSAPPKRKRPTAPDLDAIVTRFTARRK